MLCLTIRTDKPEAEIGLYSDDACLDYVAWQAHRQLSETIFVRLQQLLDDNTKSWQDLTAIACYKGPGSFTGLRIGLSVGNALGASLGIPVVSQVGDDWRQGAMDRLRKKEDEKIAVPEYGRDARITQPRK